MYRETLTRRARTTKTNARTERRPVCEANQESKVRAKTLTGNSEVERSPRKGM